AHIPSLGETQRSTGRQKGIFPKEEFRYDPDADTYTCPAGQLLKRRMYNRKRHTYEYKASSEACSVCVFRGRCTRSKDGRTLKRHRRQEALDRMLAFAASREAKRDIRTRQHLSERSFARSTRYGYKRARWRRLWRMEIQDYLVAAVQNITILANQMDMKPVWGERKRIQGLKSCFLHRIYTIIAISGENASFEPVYAYE
ncbi:MAG: transposase, partial [Spirochaetes bacterium]|nr:transposase [Spirochaetota bacterium]